MIMKSKLHLTTLVLGRYYTQSVWTNTGMDISLFISYCRILCIIL